MQVTHKGSNFAAETHCFSRAPLHLYIHVPFCKQACHYCDFHFSTSPHQRDEVIRSIVREIVLQKDYLRLGSPIEQPAQKAMLQTVYFGGGTPSLLIEAHFHQLFETIGQHFILAPDAEITLEANPDDLTPEKLALLRAFPINRLSIGIQSFHAPHLRYLNRAHTENQATSCVGLAQKAGFSNLSIDLIYAIPAESHAIWEADLAQALRLDVSHVSSYCLTIEPQTAFGKWLQRGKIKAVDEEFAAQQFEILMDTLTGHGYEQYEISNFAKPGHYSRHNRSYWQHHPYLGVGPSAHSYNGTHRQYNVANNAQYVKALANDTVPCTVEKLTVANQVNEYLMTSLRTHDGCDTQWLQRQYQLDLRGTQQSYLEACARKGLLTITPAGVIRLTTQGKLFADQIAADLFVA